MVINLRALFFILAGLFFDVAARWALRQSGEEEMHSHM
jgi:hypothetical protein